MTPNVQRSLILAVLALLMAGTRAGHFGALPDASWAVFFVGGFALSTWTKWAFPVLMAMAVAVDYVVITRSGASFWQHYCVSPAYWCLIPAYFSMWGGGLWLRRQNVGTDVRGFGLLVAAVVASVIACQLISQGSFYWFSGVVAERSLAGWWDNYVTWLLPYMATTAKYVAVAAGLHVVVDTLASGRRDGLAVS